MNFPRQDMPEAARRVGAFRAYDVHRDGRANFFLFANDHGRVDRIGFGHLDGFVRTNNPRAVLGRTGGTPLEIVCLDHLDPRTTRHVVIILDGIGYDVLRAFYDQGHLRVFHPPSRVIAPYPSLTDLCLADALDLEPTPGMEAKYFDRHANAMVGGSMSYLKGDNQPYDALLDYRANLIMDAVSYVAPGRVFRHELNNATRAFAKQPPVTFRGAGVSPACGMGVPPMRLEGVPPSPRSEFLAYFVSSAGLGTAEGEAGQIDVLRDVERLILQLLHETRGQIRLTMFSDHGHTYTPGRRLELEKHLAARGWNVTEKLKGPRDVAYVRFGLVTSASFSTDSPAELAADLVTIEGVELASHADGQSVVVYSHDGGKAIIRRADDAYRYEVLQGDPLKLLPALENVPAQPDGSYRDADLLTATVDGQYPFALQRLWRAHFDLVENPPDVIVSLADAYYSGSRWMNFFATVASTHGSLNRVNSTTFAMTTMGPLPPIMQSRDLAPAIGRLLGEPFPRNKP